MRKLLHVLNGDCTADSLRESGVPGDLTVWADVLWSGPLPDIADGDEWRRVRAGYLEGASLAQVEEAQATMRAWQAALERWREYGEIVLWFEHDLFDQVLLVRHLAWFSQERVEPGRLSLICIDRFPGIEPFHGLGQLRASQLATLFPTRQPVTTAQLESGARAWKAFTASTPSPLQQLVDRPPAELPFLAGAVRRYLEEYPALGNGLSRTERTILEAVAREPASPLSLFHETQRLEERIFMGNLSFLEILRAMAAESAPLVTLTVESSEAALPRGLVAITPLGRRVLAGEVDWVAHAGIDRWHGGVHLQGRSIPWRWDVGQGRIAAAPL